MFENVKHYAIIFGGQSTEHDASRKGFEYLYERLIRNPLTNYSLDLVVYITRDGNAIIKEPDFTKDNLYYEDSREQFDIISTFKILKEKRLFVYSILHGQNGEDGCVQGMSRFFKIEGSFGGLISCSLGMSKYHLNQYVGGMFSDITIPQTVCLKRSDDSWLRLRIFLDKEVVIKPNSLGASIMTERLILNERTKIDVLNLVNKIFEYDEKVLIQQYIRGDEYSCGCLEMNQDIEIFPLIKIITADRFFGHKEKHISGYSEEILIPLEEETNQLKKLKKIAREIFIDLDFQNAVRFDFIVTGTDIYFLEANPLPGIMKNSILPKMLRSKGLDIENLIEIGFENELNRSKVKDMLIYHID